LPGQATDPVIDRRLRLPPQQTPRVSVGTGTVAGLSGASVLFLTAILAVIDGTRTPETIATVAGGVVVLSTTIWGRMIQARELARSASPPVEARLLAAEPLRPVVTNVVGSVGTFDDEHDGEGTVPMPLGGTTHSEPVAPHDIAIEGEGYDAQVNPGDEVQDLHDHEVNPA
jgi:hypothetical protein